MKTRFVAMALAVSVVSPVVAADIKSEAPIAIPAPPSGKGQIVFFRPGGMGFALGCSVNENGQKVSSLGAGTYFIMVTDPGKHEFSVKSEATDALALEVEPDETQYAKCKIKMGIMVGRPDIAPATETEFRAAKRLKMVDAEDMGPGAGALRPEQVAAALAAPAPEPQPVATASETAPESTADALSAEGTPVADAVPAQ